MLSEKEKQFLKKLKDANIDFMIVGLSAAVLQNAPVVTKNVDLWFRELDDQKMEECCKTVDGFFLPTNLLFQMPARFGGEALENLDVVTSVNGIGSFQEEYSRALDIKLTDDLVVKVLPLDRIIASKEFVRR